LNILFLVAGRFSGTNECLIKTFSKNNHINVIEVINPTNVIRLVWGKLRLSSFLNSFLAELAAINEYGRSWKYYHWRTPFAFNKMTQYCEEAIRNYGKRKIDALLMTQTLFSFSQNKPDIPSFIFTDNTNRLTGETSFKDEFKLHFQTSPRWRRLERETYLKADKVFVMGPHVGTSLIDFYGLDPKKVVAVGGGSNITTKLNKNPEFREKSYKDRVLLFVGRDFKRKGGEDLLQAFEIVKKKFKDTKLIIAGCRPKVKIKGVEVVGELNPDQLEKYYERAQVFVMPSLFEPWGNVWIEAMTYQLPCIGTSVGSIPSIVEDGKTGFVVQPKNPKEIAERIIYLFENPHIMEKFGREGFLKAVKNFTWDKVVDTIAKEIATTLKERLNKNISTE
jgi:glycosyltransferase involved in cell wall biosynthesis